MIGWWPSTAGCWPNATPLLTAYSETSKKDHVVAWVNHYGKGRVFGTSLGHDKQTAGMDVYPHLLANGLLVYLFEDHELPLLDAVLYFKAGAIFEAADKTGLASLAATMMRVGGTEESTPDEVDEALEFRAAEVGLQAGDDMLSASVSAVKDKFPEALRLLAAMLRAPRFDSARLEVERARALEEIRRRWDDPGTIAELNFRRLVYGPSSPWGRLADAVIEEMNS